VRFGLNLMLWSGEVGQAALDLLPAIADLGYDGVELPIFAPEALDTATIRRALADAGLACTVSSALPPDASLLDPAQRDRGVRFIGRVAEAAAACGANLVCGPLYAPVGALPGRPRTPAEWSSCVAGLRAAGDVAARLGVTLAVETLNRFETFFLNTAADAVALLDEVNHPAVGLHLDTFHLNIEEKSLPDAIRQSARWLRYVHFSENDRGIVGSGHIDWIGVAAALKDVGYDGWITAETFSGRIPELAAATAIWRPIVPDELAYARETLRFARELFAR
jgi:D-psicose/D-tagatose/L-ribulose 3-epimerase